MRNESIQAHIRTSRQGRLSRRRVLGSATALGLGVAGLSPGGPALTARPLAQAPTPGGTLGIGLPIEPDILDPHTGSSRYDTVVERMLYDTLVYRTETGEFQPFLATAWETSEDGLAWTIHLREDVKFHDGTPFNA